MKKLKISSLYTAVALTLSAMATQHTYASNAYKTIGDLEIYQKPEQGSTTVSMMLDISGSMYIVDLGTSTGTGRNRLPNQGVIGTLPNGRQTTQCAYGYNWRTRTANAFINAQTVNITIPITDENGNQVNSITFAVMGCPNQANQTISVTNNNTFNPTIVNGRENRISSLKLGLIGLLADGKAVEAHNSIGIGEFPFNSFRGRMGVPAQPLTLAHRQRLINYVANLSPFSSTPIAAAYAEVSSYMLGTSTVSPYRVVWDATNRVNVLVNGGTRGTEISGFTSSDNSTKTADRSRYQSPLQGANASECSINGIYFLTDGFPNSNFAEGTTDLMTRALGRRPAGNPARRLPTAGTESGVSSGWEQIGMLSQEIAQPSTLAPKGLRTATVGFGGDFAAFRNVVVEVVKPGGEKIKQSVPDCVNSPVNQDAKNLCLWGELPGVVTDTSAPDTGRATGHFGLGGFTNTSTPEGLQDSVRNFFSSLKLDIAASPSGTISIPSDPLNALTIQPYAYLPMIQPRVGQTDAVWQGNLKKYHTLFGTLYGQNNQRLYIADANKATAGNERFPSQLNPLAKDLWQDASDTGSAGLISTGGSRGRIVQQDTANLATKTSRVVYIEGGSATSPQTVKVQIVNGIMTFAPANPDLSRYSIEDLAYLADYLGFNVPKEASNYTGANLTAQIAALNTRIQATAMTNTTIFGGVSHSVPVLASYEGKFDTNTGNINTNASTRKDYVIYGTMEGSLRMATAERGEEAFSFIPRTIFDNQKKALAFDSTAQQVDQPFFGVDAPWATSASYTYDRDGVKATDMRAYGGLRMGGVGFYGLDIKDPLNPKIDFAITNSTSGFARLGQTWSKPTVTKIKTGPGDNDVLDVLVFGGGYDMCYENPKFTLNDPSNADANCANKSEAQGNAIYMIDAKTGRQIAKWERSGSGGDDRKEMTHSFVGEMVALDRNNNGFVDSIYASDLGGQLFRIDLKEGTRGSDITRRVVRVFNANDGSLPADAPPLRFYEKPMVSFYDHNNGTLAMVNIASGDRSSPLHTHRDTLAKSNRIYGIIDRDLTTHRILAPGMPSITRNLTHSNLQEYDTARLKSMSNADRVELINNLRTPRTDGTYVAQGWWYPMTRFDTYTDVKNLKAVGSSLVSGGILYTSIYNPDYQYTKGENCTARVVGATERQMFCLPWGICANVNTGELLPRSPNGTLGFSKAGPGIQEIAMSTLTSRENTSTNFKIFVGQQTVKERTDDSRSTVPGPAVNAADSPVSSGNATQRGDGFNPVEGKLEIAMGKKLTVDRWYDLANAESNQ